MLLFTKAVSRQSSTISSVKVVDVVLMATPGGLGIYAVIVTWYNPKDNWLVALKVKVRVGPSNKNQDGLAIVVP